MEMKKRKITILELLAKEGKTPYRPNWKKDKINPWITFTYENYPDQLLSMDEKGAVTSVTSTYYAR